MNGSLLMTVCITLANVLAISGHESNCCKCDCDALQQQQQQQQQKIYYSPSATSTHQYVQVPTNVVQVPSPVLLNHHLYVQPEVHAVVQNERPVQKILVVEGGNNAEELKEATHLQQEVQEEEQVQQPLQNKYQEISSNHQKTRYQYKLTHPRKHNDIDSKATHYVSFQQSHPAKSVALDDKTSDQHHHKDKNVHYKFEYAVNDQKTHDIKHHKEERNGDVVKGEYSLVEEDGNVRTVKYYADWKTGFHAQVHNSKSQKQISG